MQGEKIKFKERKPLFALALSLFLTGLGQLYNGKLRKGILLCLSSIIIPFLLFQLSVFGPYKMPAVFLLLSLLASAGIYIWAAVDAWKQAKRIGKNYKLRIYNKISVYILLIIVLNLFYYGPIVDWQKIFIFARPYRMSSGSMAPTLLPGDLILTDGRIDHSAENHSLKRGELVVFKYPKNKEKHFIKRVIGLPGDEIEIKGMELFVNGEKKTGKEVAPQNERRADNLPKGAVVFYEEIDQKTYEILFVEGTSRKDLNLRFLLKRLGLAI